MLRDLPNVSSRFSYSHLRIYRPSSPDLLTLVSRFTYCHLQIYLPSSPDLPTIITGFTYPRLRIYLPSSPDLPTVVFGLFFKISSKIQHGDHFPLIFQKRIHMVIIFWFTMVIIFWCWSFSVLPLKHCQNTYRHLPTGRSRYDP